MADHKLPVVRVEKCGSLSIIRMENPPINAGSVEARRGLLKAFHEFADDPSQDRAILTGTAQNFMGGSDLREFNAPVQDPHLTEIIDLIEAIEKPVVAAITGAALGGGYELSLGCDYRIATETSVVGLPECQLGMMPGAGGTQKLPRLIGLVPAIPIICEGTRIRASKALELGMIDAIASGDLIEFCKVWLDNAGPKKRRAIEIPLPSVDWVAANEAKSLALQKGLNRPNILLALESIERCINVEPKSALEIERQNFLTLRSGPEAQAKLNLFFAARDATRRAGHISAQISDIILHGPIDNSIVMQARKRGITIADSTGPEISLKSKDHPDINIAIITVGENNAIPSRVVVVIDAEALSGSFVEVAVLSGAGDRAKDCALRFCRALSLVPIISNVESAPVSVSLYNKVLSEMHSLREIGYSSRQIEYSLMRFGYKGGYSSSSLMNALNEPEKDLQDICQRVSSAMSFEGVRLIATRQVDRPTDVDLFSVGHLGFPSFEGGVMYWSFKNDADRYYK